METIREIGNDRQLFLDDSLCAERENVCLVMNRPVRTGEVLLQPTAEEQATGRTIDTYSCVRREKGITRLWYYANCREDIGRRRLCYAESEDGLLFSRPAFSRQVNGGLEPENAVIGDPIQGGHVWVDPNAPAARRYRTQAKWGPPAKFPGTGESLHFYASPDGLSWEETHYLHIGDCDTQNLVFFDERYRRYVMYTRRWVRFDDENHSYRQVRRLESDDLVTWDNERVIMEADEADRLRRQTSTGRPPVDCYGACVFKYPEAGDFYIMLLQQFWHWKDRPDHEKWGYSPDPERLDRRMIHLAPAVIDTRLAYSRDGIHFERACDRGPFLGVGPEGAFDSRGVWMLPDPIVNEHDIWFYYAGTNRDHDNFVDPSVGERRSGIARAVMRRDGFVSADADYRGGHVVTPVLRFDRGELELNVMASAGGSVRVDVLDEHSRPLRGFSGESSRLLCGDSVQLPVRWSAGGAAELAGRPVRLLFHLREASLYSFQVRP